MSKRAFYSQWDVSQRYEQQRFGGPSGEWVNERELSFVASFMPSTGRVLDLGCGTGRASLFLANRGNWVVGLDSSAAMLTLAMRKPGSEQVRWVLGDLFALPFTPGSFDGAVVLRVAFHYKDLRALLMSIVQVLRPGAHVVLDTYNWSPRAPVGIGRKQWGPRVYVHRRSDVAIAAPEAGLRIVQHEDCFLFSPYLYALMPPRMLNALLSLERRVPAQVRARVFWHMQVLE